MIANCSLVMPYRHAVDASDWHGLQSDENPLVRLESLENSP